MLTSSYTSEDDHFRNRLDSINKEMQAIIERTANERDRMFSGCATLPTSCKFTDRTPVEEAESAPFPRTSATPHVRIDEAAVRRIVADEMNLWKTTLQNILSQALMGVNSAVKQRLEEVSRQQTEFAESLREAGEMSRRGIGEMQSSLNRVQRCTTRSVEDLSRQLDGHVSRITLEQTSLRDAICALQNEARIDQQRKDRRVDELVRRHHDLVRSSLLELDTHMAALRDEVQTMVRAQTRPIIEEQDVIEQHVARLQGTLEATNDTTVRWAAELHNLLEENVMCKSELRACCRNVSHLENFLQRMLSGSSDISVISKRQRSTNFDETAGCWGGIQASSGDFLALKERVSRVESQMRKMDQKIANMIVSSRFSAADGNGVNVDSFANGETHKKVGKVLDQHEFSATKKAPLTDEAHPQPLVQFSGQTMQKQHDKVVPKTHAKSGFSAMTRVKESAPSDIIPQSLPGLLPTRVSEQQRAYASRDELMKTLQQQEQEEKGHEGNNRNNYKENVYKDLDQSCVSDFLDRSVYPTEKYSHEHVGVSQTLGSSSPAALRLTAQDKMATVASAPPIANSPVSTKHSTASNSYVSEIEYERRGNATSTQYVPAPTSDIESELDNNKMARLALD